MLMNTEAYSVSQQQLPPTGRHIVGYQDEQHIVVYQAYKHSIANFAVAHQQLGGSEFSYNRMSWIKPNFLWMMFRCGWAQKENQERVLALWVTKRDFETILREAVPSTFVPQRYATHEQWQNDLSAKEVRLQWDPDHNPYGEKLERRAIQLGLKGAVLEHFGKRYVQRIEDVTAFVTQQKNNLDSGGLQQLVVPVETVYSVADDVLRKQLGLSC